jgi:hypothetical protein
MGNDVKYSHQNAAFGGIFIQTDKPHYMNAENVTGKIYLNLHASYPGTTLFIKIKGEGIFTNFPRELSIPDPPHRKLRGKRPAPHPLNHTNPQRGKIFLPSKNPDFHFHKPNPSRPIHLPFPVPAVPEPPCLLPLPGHSQRPPLQSLHQIHGQSGNQPHWKKRPRYEKQTRIGTQGTPAIDCPKQRGINDHKFENLVLY